MRLYNEEVSNHLALLAERRESLHTRAGLLVASAAIATSIATAGELTQMTTGAMILGVAAAVLGVIALWPIQTDTTKIDTVRSALLRDESADTIERIADTKFVQVRAARKRLLTKGYIIRAGFVVLLVAIFATVGQALRVSITIGAPIVG
jgi:hypothetical protein